jgi:hypothetical protein
MTPTPENLRDVAWTLDQLSRILGDAIESAAAMIPLNADTLDVTLQFTSSGDGWWTSREEADALLDWVTGTEQQDDLRAWADELEAADRDG